jgi:hypothetical protein
VTASSFRPVVLRNGVYISDPLSIVLGFLKARWPFDVSDPSRFASFGEPDLRLANRGGARISAAQIAAILERRPAIEPALRAIPPHASLTDAADAADAVNLVPWLPLRQLFDAFADIRGVGFSKMTKALHPKRPALIPMLDSVVQGYLLTGETSLPDAFGEGAAALVRSYKRDLDRNRAALREIRRKLGRRGDTLTEVRILDLVIWSVSAAG